LARVRTTLWTLLFAPLMWLPILVVGMLVLFGVDIYEYANTGWLVASVLFGLAVIPSAIFLARRYGPRVKGSATLGRLADAVAGQTLFCSPRIARHHPPLRGILGSEEAPA
jgi:membrane protein implicated in regulation of membrane protease activity